MWVYVSGGLLAKAEANAARAHVPLVPATLAGNNITGSATVTSGRFSACTHAISASVSLKVDYTYTKIDLS